MPLSAVAARRLAAAQKQANEAVAAAPPVVDLHTTDRDQPDTIPSPSLNSTVQEDSPKEKQSRKRKRASRPVPRVDESFDQSSLHEEQVSVTAPLATPEDKDLPQENNRRIDEISGDIAMDVDPLSDISEDDSASDRPSYDSEGDETDSDVSSTKSLELKPVLNVRLTTAPQTAIKFDTKDASTTAKLQPGDTLVAIGVYDLYVHEGSVVVLGAVLHAAARGKPKPYRVHAPSSHSLPVIRALQRPDVGQPSPAVVKLRGCESVLPRLNRLHSSFNRLFTVSDLSYQVLRESAEDPLGRQLQEVKEDSTWQDARQACVAEFRTSKVAVCGSKGTGKSSFVRFLVNSFLSLPDCGGVMLLDLDPGQPEYGLPGDLTLCHIENFNLGPAYSHSGDTVGGRVVKTQHFGFLTPRDNVEHYMACVRDLFDAYLKDFIKLPLVVNFSGWILGRGMDITQRIATTIAPSQLVFMGAAPSAEVAHGLTSISRVTGARLLTAQAYVSDISQRSPKDLRIMQTMSYFHMGSAPQNYKTSITCLQQIQAQEWPFDGSDKLVEGFWFYQDDVTTGMVELLTCGSIFSIIAVRGDPAIDEAVKMSKSELGDNASGPVFWQDVRVDSPIPSASQEDEQDAKPGKLSGLSLQRSPEGLPYFSHADGAYEPLNPSFSQAIGQAYMRNIDVEAGSLRVTSPVVRETLNILRKGGAKIILVRGRLDMPDWMSLEPYHAGVYDQREAGTDLGEQVSEFDIVKWAKATDRVQIMDKTDVAARHRMRPWRLRRNLETHDRKKT